MPPTAIMPSPSGAPMVEILAGDTPSTTADAALNPLRQDRDDVVRKSIRGAAALGVRQMFVHAANVLGAVLLARFLSPAEFGVYAIVTFLISFLGTFGGTGLAANLIRVHDAPSEHDCH